MNRIKLNLKLWHLTALTFTFFNLGSQAQNAIRFDGTNDYVSATNGSSLIAGSSEISMSMWVYPENTAAGWPDFDGFGGFRNNTDADFYLMQLGSTDIEARFRNSAGGIFTMGYSGLTLNAWNHFVLTYDGTSLILYHNGTPVDTIAANGTITNTTTPFDMGYLYYTTSTNSFYLQGKLDHVGLWDRALTNTEVASMYTDICEYDTADVNLMLSYEFSQGIVGSDNTAIPSVTDSKGNIDGTFYNMALLTSISNFTSGINGASTGAVSETVCDSYTVPSGNATYNVSGTYADTLVNAIGCDSILYIDLTVTPLTSSTVETACFSYLSPAGNVYTVSGTYEDTISSTAGCDSIITTNLTINTIDTSVTQLEDTLTAVATSATYQWLDCTTNTIVSGATGQNFTPVANGDFALIITGNGCTDTSSCHTVTISATGISGADILGNALMYPNPTTGNFRIDLASTVKDLNLTVSDISGRVVINRHFQNSEIIKLSLSNEPDGIYHVHLVLPYHTAIIRVVKTSGN